MKKIAVINRSNFKNYGSVLQCYALCEAIRSLGLESELVWVRGNLSENYDFRLNKIISSLFKLATHPYLLKSTVKNVGDMNSRVINEKTTRLFDEFGQNYINQKLYTINELKKVSRNLYDKIICGSDQIWCSTTLYVDPLMYLRFAPESRRIAYAPSIGRDYIPKYNSSKMKRYISQIPHLSVREMKGKELIKELCGRDAVLVCDPTLLLSKNHYRTMQNKVEGVENALVCYFLDVPSEKTQKKIADFAKNNDDKIVCLGCRLEYLEKVCDVVYPDCGPKEFLYVIDCAQRVFTDSYHGMLFSIIFEKNFLSIEREYREYDQSSRQKTILEMFGLDAFYITENDEITENKIDYKSFSEEKNNFIHDSLKFLKESIAE